MNQIAQIQIGTRHRTDMGDLNELAESIRTMGLLQPVGITADLQLVFGERRLRACRDILGWSDIPTRIVDVPSIVEAEHDENEVRKNFTMSERVAIGRAVEDEVGERRGRDNVQNIAQYEGSKTRDIAADKAGFGNAETYRQAKTVVDRGTPDLVEAVDTGKVSVSAAAEVSALPHDEQAKVVALGPEEIIRQAGLLREKRAEENAHKRAEIAAQKAIMPEGKFGTIIIDPPWPMQKIDRDVRPNQVGFDYPTMSEAELVAFGESVTACAGDDCHMFMWTTQKFMPMALRVLDAWGFRYVLTMVWHKPGGFQPIGLPQYNCEFAIYARKGAPVFTDTKAFNCCFDAPRREHSRKPDEFYDLVRRVTSEGRIDIFSREPRDGFAQLGNEAEKFAEVA